MNDNTNESELSAPEEIKSFRADATSTDRPDLPFSAEGVSRAMSKSMKKDQRRIVRMARNTWRILRNKESSKNSSSRRWTPPSQRTRTQIGQVADPAGRARQVELY